VCQVVMGDKRSRLQYSLIVIVICYVVTLLDGYWSVHNHEVVICHCQHTALCACQSRFFQLQKLRPTVWSLTTTAAETLIYEFISCTVDYCNSLLCDVSDGLVLSYSRSRTPPSTSCLITGTRWWDHYKHLPVSSVLRSTSVALPSCPIEFKAAYLVCQ